MRWRSCSSGRAMAGCSIGICRIWMRRRWRSRFVVSYGDFITLLFAFYVVLYASSQVDKRKAGKLALSIQVAFQELGVFETSNTLIPLNDSESIPFSKIQVVEN